MSAPLALLLDAALRASALGIMVAMLLKLARLRDVRAEILIWTAVLLAALAMPLLRMELPAWLAIPLPHMAFATAATPPGSAAAPGHVLMLLGSGHGMALVPANSQSLTVPEGLLSHGAQLLWLFYLLAAAIQLARLTIGLYLTARLYRAAEPVAASWAAGRAIRASASVAGPISFGRCILLPVDYTDWPRNKLLAVLAHEESHVRRGDFFILLLAALYRAAFWFSPFAWWLQARLSALAEAASDEAAIQCLNDRATYAEILVEVSRRAHGLPIQVAMAKSANIHWRIDRILGENRERRLGARVRLAAAAAILPAALIIAGAQAAGPSTPALPRLVVRTAQSTISIRPAISLPKPAIAAPATRHARSVHRVVRPARIEMVAAGADADVTYNPRALLENQAVAIFPAILFTGNSANR